MMFELMPTKVALAATAESVIQPLVDHPMTAWDHPDHEDSLAFCWLDDHTLAECVLIGIAIGANLPWGSCSELEKKAFEVTPEKSAEYDDWLANEISRPLEKGDVMAACRALNDVPKIMATCAAIRIGRDALPDQKERIISVVKEATEVGYQED